MAKKVKLNHQESEEMMPIIREFNNISGAIAGLLGQRVASKERKISVMVSRIKRPNEQTGQIKLKTVEFTKGFKKTRKKLKTKINQKDDNFTEKQVYLMCTLIHSGGWPYHRAIIGSL